MAHNSSFLRAPLSPTAAQLLAPHKGTSRRPLIVEMLSSPPPLPADHQPLPDELSLLANTLISSFLSSLLHQPPPAGQDWSEIPLADLVELNKLVAINSSYSVQKAFETLIEHDLTSLPVLRSRNNFDLANCLSFDYSDLNTYLLLVMNKINLNDLNVADIQDEPGAPSSLQAKQEKLLAMIGRAKKGEEVPVDFIVHLHPKTPLVKLKDSETLLRAVEAFGNGVHRVAILAGDRISGILSQRRTIRYIWENARRFPSLEFLLNSTLQDLKIGSTSPMTVYGDQPLIEALLLMFHERVSSLAVIDRNKCLVGNISIVDVKNVSLTKNSHYLFRPVINFISYNLSQKGIERGQDQFPIFHVGKDLSLARVIAKLVATQSHRLWIVESKLLTSSYSSNSGGSGTPSTVETALADTAVAPETGRPGTLVGVVTLTDILGLFAHHKSGVKVDPQAARNERRRLLTSTTRSSFESGTSGPYTSTPSAPATPQHNAVPLNQDMFRKA